jgi:hypothetical protein
VGRVELTNQHHDMLGHLTLAAPCNYKHTTLQQVTVINNTRSIAIFISVLSTAIDLHYLKVVRYILRIWHRRHIFRVLSCIQFRTYLCKLFTQQVAHY